MRNYTDEEIEERERERRVMLRNSFSFSFVQDIFKFFGQLYFCFCISKATGKIILIKFDSKFSFLNKWKDN